MHPELTLDQLTDAPQLTVSIGGRFYQFSELPLDALGRLQAWIKQAVPNPIDAVKPHLAGLNPEDRRALLDRAYDDALSWPPILGTAAGAKALLSGEPGQTEAFCEGLSIHQPQISRAEAVRLYKTLLRDAARDRSAARTAARIFAVLFGAPDPERAGGSGTGLPKDPAAGPTAAPGR